MNTYGGRRRLRTAGVVLGAAMVLAAGVSNGTMAVADETADASAAEPARTDGATTASDDGAGDDTKALAQAARTGKLVEITSLRGESSEVFATPEGHLEAREHLRPVRTRVDGEWRDIDTTLTRGADGAVTPKVTTVGLTFSGGVRHRWCGC